MSAGRRLYRQMANARGALNHMHRGVLSADETAQIAQEQARTRALRERHAAPAERIHHQAIKAPEHKCYRVVRRWKNEEYGEDIGWLGTYEHALWVMNRELGWAIVLDRNGKRIGHNFQPMETRP